MPGNIELIAAIEAEANAKGVDVPSTDGLNNAKLTEILNGLKGLAPAPAPGGAEADAKAKEEADVKAKEEADAKAKEEADAKPPYYMADGKSLTSKKGILSEGNEVKAKYLHDGAEGLKRHVKNGLIIES